MASIKCVVVGDGGVGKTSLLISYTTSRFPLQYTPTVFDSYAVSILVADVPYTLCLFDTAGQEDFDRLRPLSYPATDVFVVCFSVVRPTSLENIKVKWLPELSHYSPGVPCILVGTQIDLRDDTKTLAQLAKEDERPVSKEAGRKFALRSGMQEYFECSALQQRGLKEIFDEAITIALQPKLTATAKRCIVL